MRTPVKFRESGLPEYRKGPRIGEHTREVLEKLGYTDAEIAAMQEKGAVKLYGQEAGK